MALNALEVSGVSFALLHDEDRLLEHRIESDVDIAVERSPRSVLAESLASLHASDLHPIVVNHYDAGGSASAYISTRDGANGLQLDMYFDPKGVGRLGLRTGPIMESSVTGIRWQIVAPEYRDLYLLRKRHWKRDEQQLALARQRLATHDSKQVKRAIESLAEPEIQTSIRRLLKGDQHEFIVARRHRVPDLYRRFHRLRTPVGFWVEIIGTEAEAPARQLAQRFDRFIATKIGERPHRVDAMAYWLARQVAPSRLRPSLYVSWTSDRSRTLRADLEIASSERSVSDLAHRIVAAMETRLQL